MILIDGHNTNLTCREDVVNLPGGGGADTELLAFASDLRAESQRNR